MSVLGTTDVTGMFIVGVIAFVYAWLEAMQRYRGRHISLPVCRWVWLGAVVNAVGAVIAYIILSNSIRTNLARDPTTAIALVLVASVSSWGVLRAPLPHTSLMPAERAARQRALAVLDVFQERADQEVREREEHNLGRERRQARTLVIGLSPGSELAQRLSYHCHRLAAEPKPTGRRVSEMRATIAATEKSPTATDHEKLIVLADELSAVYGQRILAEAVDLLRAGELPAHSAP